MKYKLIIVCGLHRSGTTYVGKVLSLAPSVFYLHEPSNSAFGVAKGHVWYPYVRPDEPAGTDLARLYEDIVHFRGTWSRTIDEKKGPLTRLAMRLFGGRYGFTWQVLKIIRSIGALPRMVCWKDPFATLSAEYLVRKYSAKVLCMVRHPAALYQSAKRLNWHFDVNNLIVQKELTRRFGHDIPKSHWDLALINDAAAHALLWKIMARVIRSVGTKDLLAITHEEFCADPVGTLARICDHMNIRCTGAMKDYVERTTSDETGTNDSCDVQNFSRDSASIVDDWRAKITGNDEQVIREIVGPDISLFYSHW